MRRRAVLTGVLLILMATGCTAQVAVPVGTQIVEVRLLGDDNRVPAGWSVSSDGSIPALDCYAPSMYARGANIQSCGSHADGGSVCWAPPDQSNLYCSEDPWGHTVRKLASNQTLTEVPAPIDPVPWGLELSDGSRCAVRTGGAWPGGPNGTIPTYICGEKDPTHYVLATPDQQAVDTSTPIWTVLGGDIEVDSIKPADPVRIAVAAAYYAA